MHIWSLQNAKARFSELVNECLENGPQLVTRHGREAVVIMPADEYKRVIGFEQGLKEFLLSAPRVELDIDRAKDTGRSIQL
jgi:antitoxin Phd